MIRLESSEPRAGAMCTCAVANLPWFLIFESFLVLHGVVANSYPTHTTSLSTKSGVEQSQRQEKKVQQDELQNLLIAVMHVSWR